MSDFSNELPRLFGTAFVISLPERTDRLRATNAQFNSVGWKNIRVFPGLKFDDPAGFKNTGWRGCFQSHFACLKIAHAEGRDSVLIFEDDIALAPTFPRLMPSITKVVTELPWDFLYFGHENSGSIPKATSSTNEVQFKTTTKEFIGGHFYAVRKRIIPRLISHFGRVANGQPGDNDFGPMLPDGAYNTFRRHNHDIKTYISIPKLGWQRPSRSDVSPISIDEIRPLRPIISLVRRIKDSIERL